MPNQVKIDFINRLEDKYGKIKKLPNSLSLFDVGNEALRLYIRYSKIHEKNQSFFGLRDTDLKQIEGIKSVIVFLWDNQSEPLFVPYSDFEDVFGGLEPVSDGQHKVQLYHSQNQLEMYISKAGRFNVEGFIGWHFLDGMINKSISHLPEFSHSQIQTIIGAIGLSKGFDIWIPRADRGKLDYELADNLQSIRELPGRYEKIMDIIKEIDIIWLKRGSSDLSAFFEVEHSTPIYSGLLRFNDLYLSEPHLNPKFSIIANDLRKSSFLREAEQRERKIKDDGFNPDYDELSLFRKNI